MIEKSFLEKMTLEELSAEFKEDSRVINENFDNSGYLEMAGHISKEQKEIIIDSLFDEMKQIWLRKLEIEKRGK